MQILMCPPDFYGIEYEINPWMKTERQADHVLAAEQWSQLREALEHAGAEIMTMQPVKGLPDLVFTANAGLVFERQVILSRFLHEQRQGEETHNRAWFERHRFEVVDLPESICFEGAGDALFCGDTLWAGYRMRSDVLAHQHIAERIGRRVIPLELVDPYFYHLDTCFCPLTPDTALYFPGAFDEYGLAALAEAVPHLVEVAQEEARAFACNAVVVGSTVVTSDGCPMLHASLAKLGFQPISTPLSEFVKAGGSAKCLTLRLDGEDAASWSHSA